MFNKQKVQKKKTFIIVEICCFLCSIELCEVNSFGIWTVSRTNEQFKEALQNGEDILTFFTDF